MTKQLIFLFVIGCSIQLHANVLDSLTQLYEIESDDSLKARHCLVIGDYYENRKTNEAIKWGKRALKHAERFGNKEFQIRVLNYLATYYQRKGDYAQQINLCLKAFRMAERFGFHELKSGLASNIGGAYIRLEEDKQAMKWLDKSLEISRKYHLRSKEASALSNLASYYFEKGNFDESIKYQKEALQIRKDLGEKDRLAVGLSNLADNYLILNDFENAQKLFNEALKMYKESNDGYGVSKVYLDFSFMFERMKKSEIAIRYADSAFVLAEKMTFTELGHDAAIQLAHLHENRGNFDVAYQFQKKAYDYWKLLNKEETAKSLNELRTTYEIEQFESENLLLKKDNTIKDLDIEKNKAKIERQNTIILSSIIGLVFLVAIVYLLMKWNKEKRVKNDLLSKQKQELQQKNTEILDSILYAKRIQAAILPPKSRIQELLPESFVLYEPKDVVAGDFYWVEEKNGFVLFAAADCTGHGVPGAMVSVVCNNGLNRSVREHGLTSPGLILDKARQIVREEFEKSEEEVHDGMDISICSIIGNSLQFAGANNPFWLIRKGELIEIKADKQPIGRFENAVSYTTHNVELQEEDCIYLFTDGFVDQFGGKEDKKYKSTNFKKFLLSIQDLKMSEQYQALLAEFIEWKGEGEQIDDLCVFGVKFKSV